MKINLEDVITLPAINEGIATGEVTIDGFVPAAEGEIKQDPVSVTITENGSTTIKAADVDREEREAQGLTPWDGLAQVDVTVDVPTGPITSFEGTKVFDSINDMSELNDYDVKGALVSYDSETGKYTVWNGEADLDSRAWDYRADHTDQADSLYAEEKLLYANDWSSAITFPDTYGDVIAVCIGDGKWVYTKWNTTNEGNGWKWCKQDGTLWDWQLGPALSGYDLSQALMDKVTADDESLFYTLKNTGMDDGTNGHLYVPSAVEIIDNKYRICKYADREVAVDEETYDIYYDFTTALAHACGIVGNDESFNAYWSSSQFQYGSSRAYSLYYYGFVYFDLKNGSYPCLVCVQF